MLNPQDSNFDPLVECGVSCMQNVLCLMVGGIMSVLCGVCPIAVCNAEYAVWSVVQSIQ